MRRAGGSVVPLTLVRVRPGIGPPLLERLDELETLSAEMQVISASVYYAKDETRAVFEAEQCLRGKIVTRDACASVSERINSWAAPSHDTNSSLLFGHVFARARDADVNPMGALSHAALLTHADPRGADVRKLKSCLDLAELAASNAAHKYDRAHEGTARLRANCGKL